MSMGYIKHGTYHKVADGGAFAPKPDWAHAISISGSQMYTGYIAPSNGMFVGSVYFNLSPESPRASALINSIPVSVASLAQPDTSGVIGDLSVLSLQVPVKVGDRLGITSIPADDYVYVYFVPWKE